MKPNSEHNAIKISEVIKTEYGVITSISIQKKNSTRYSVYVNEKFLIGVSDNSLVKFALSKGKSIDQELLDAIQVNEEKWAIHSFCLRLLGRRDHASFELKQKATKKGYSSIYLDTICSDLEEKGYINNTEFAKKFARDKFEFNNWGTQKIRNELMRKGLQKDDITSALDEINKEDMIDKMNHLFEKSRLKFQRVDPLKRKKKIFDFFLRKGYEPEIILNSMDDFINQLSI